MAKRTKTFKAEVRQLLDLVVHSLYSHKEIFLRELISNASDAIDRARFEALTDEKIQRPDEEWKIWIETDKDKGILKVSDNGIGMTMEDVEKNIGTIANSGTGNFLKRIKDGESVSPEFIGQFGVGFYSAFMVAEKVEILTRRAGGDETAVYWVSDGMGRYTIEEAEKEDAGTEITLHLREDMSHFLEPWEIKRIVREYSDYIAFPIEMDVPRKEKDKETIEKEILNSRKAIWKKSKNDVAEDEYKAFYHHIAHDTADPLETIHYVAEGATEFFALLFIPRAAPFDLFMREGRRGIHLYVKNVFITDDCKELVPEYLRFVRGVVDSSDLPLNISREMIQDDVLVSKIRKNIVSKILGVLKEMMDKRPDDYRLFYKEFGKVMKEGIYGDFENRDKLKDLLLFYSSKTEEGYPVSLRDYVDRMPEGQKEIYYITGESIGVVAEAPHLETFKARGYEVIFFTDPIDEWAVHSIDEYDGRKLKAVDRDDIELDETEDDQQKEESKEKDDSLDGLIKHISEELEDTIKEVRLSRRLTESACCLVADAQGINPNMERILRAMNQEAPTSKRILELNAAHPVIQRMRELYEKDRKSQKLKDAIELLYEQALITEGSAPRNPKRFTRLVSELMTGM